MKALKEKRINLRSLWRRSLVILSLLALVFAACGDSGSGDDGGVVVPTNITVSGAVENISYQGYPPDLTGFTFRVTYSDGKVQEFTDTRQFVIEPPIVTGWWRLNTAGTAVTWVPHQDYRVRYGARSVDVEIPAAQIRGLGRLGWNINEVITGVPIEPSVITNEYYLSSQGLHVHGSNRMKDTYYVDDLPDFSRLTAEAFYPHPTIAGQITIKEFDVPAAARWGGAQGVIQPLYNGAPSRADDTGTGLFYVTFGRNPWFQPRYALSGQASVTDGTHPSIPWGSVDYSIPGVARGRYNGLFPDSGLTSVMPLREVYHVTGLEFNSAPNFEPVFYWEPHYWYIDMVTGASAIGGGNIGNVASLGEAQLTPRDRRSGATNRETLEWLRRSQGVSFDVTYSNGQTYNRSLDFMRNAPDVWFNPHFAGVQVNHPNRAPTEEFEARPFWVRGLIRGNVGVSYNANGVRTWRRPSGYGVNGEGAQEVTFYYRGWQVSQPVTVWNRLDSLTVVSNSGQQINMDMALGQDNDNISGLPGTAREFALMVTVTANYSQRGFPERVNPVELTYNHGLSVRNRFANAQLLLPGDAAASASNYVGRPPLASFSDIGVATGVGSIANLGRVYSMDFGAATSSDLAITGTGTAANAWGQAFNFQNNGTSNRVNIWYAAPRIPSFPADNVANRPVAPTIDGFEVEDEEVVVPGATGTEGNETGPWWFAALGRPMATEISVGWRNVTGFSEP